jgi:hypothetical protein
MASAAAAALGAVHAMKLQLVAPRQGLVWVGNAFRVFARQPLGFAALFATCLFVVLLLGIVPVVGTVAALALPPAGSLLFMIASRRVVAGRTAMPGSIAELAAAGRPRLVALVKLGVAYAAGTFALLWLAGVLDGGALVAFLESLPDERTTGEAAALRVADPRVQLGVILRLAFAGALSVPFWHAPALVHWGGQGWAKSLFFSSVAIWRNKGAFAVYGIAWLGVWMLLLPLLSIAVVVLGAQRLAIVAMPLTLAYMTLFCASFWFTFADCFSPDDAAPPRERVDPTDPPQQIDIEKGPP